MIAAFALFTHVCVEYNCRAKLAKKHVIILSWLDRKGNSFNIGSLCLCQIRAAGNFKPQLMQSSHVSIVNVCVWLLKKTQHTASHKLPFYFTDGKRLHASLHTLIMRNYISPKKSLTKGQRAYADRLHFQTNTEKV